MIKPAESEGYDLTKEEAESYLEEIADFEMDEEALKQQAVRDYCYAVGGCFWHL